MKKALAVAVVMIVAGSASAAVFNWTGGAGAGTSWQTAGNWAEGAWPNDGTAELKGINIGADPGWNPGSVNMTIKSLDLTGGTYGPWSEQKVWNGDGRITFSGGGTCVVNANLMVEFVSYFTLAAGITTFQNDSENFIIADGWWTRGQINGAGGIRITGLTGNGRMRFESPSSTFTGGIRVENGFALMQDNNTVVNGVMTAGPFGLGTLTLAGGGVDGGDHNYWNPTGNASRTFYNAIDIEANSTLARGTGNTLTFNGTTRLTGNANLTVNSTSVFNKPIGEDAPSRSLGILGAGTMYLNGANTYTGATTVKSGTLVVSLANSLDLSASLQVGDATAGNSAFLLSVPMTWAKGITVGAGSSGTSTIGNKFNSGASKFTGAITLNKAATFTAPGTSTLEIAGALSGTGAVTMTGGGSFTITGANTVTGDMKVAGNSTLKILSNADLGNVANAVVLGAGTTEAGTLWVANDIATARNFTVGGLGGNLNVSAGKTLSITGAIGGTGGIKKIGDGMLMLDANNTFTGGITINAGTVAGIARAGATPFGANAVTMNISASFELTGVDANTTTTLAGLTYNGMNTLVVNNTVAGRSTTVSLASATRGGMGTLLILPYSGGLGTSEKMLFATPPTITNGMMAPAILAANSNVDSAANFASYDAAMGVIPATYNGTNLSAGADKIVKLTAGETLSASKQVYALKTAYSIGGSSELVLGSGGLLIDAGCSTITPAVTSGSSGSPGEMIVYVAGGASPTISGAVKASNFVKSGPGNLVLTSGSNVISGLLGVNAGTLDVQSNLNVTGITGGGQLTNSSAGGTIVINSAVVNTFMGTVAGNVQLTINGAGQIFTGQIDAAGLTANVPVTVSAPVTLDAMTANAAVTLSGAANVTALTANAPVTLSGAATIGGMTIGETTVTAPTMSLSGTVRATGTTSTLVGGVDMGSTSCEFNVDEGKTLLLSAVVGGSGDLVKTGKGMVSLESLDNSFRRTWIKEGTAKATTADIMDSGNTKWGSNYEMAWIGDTSNVGGARDATMVWYVTEERSNRAIRVKAGNDGKATLELGTRWSQYSGNITLEKDLTIRVAITQTGADQFATLLAGIKEDVPGCGITKTGPGQLAFSQSGLDAWSSNTYTGPTRVYEGQLTLAKWGLGNNAINGPLVIGDGVGALVGTVSINNYNQIKDTSLVTVNNNGVLQFGGDNLTETIGGLAGSAGGQVVTRAGVVLTIGSAADTEFAGVISGDGSLVHSGAGTLRLSGANTFTGPTAVNAGTLRVDGSMTGIVNVAAAGTLTGSGTMTNFMNATGGTIAPLGKLTVGAAVFARTAGNVPTVMPIHITGMGGVAGVDFEQLKVTGAVTGLTGDAATTGLQLQVDLPIPSGTFDPNALGPMTIVSSFNDMSGMVADAVCTSFPSPYGYQLTVSGTSGALQLSAYWVALPGDADLNGLIDGGDYDLLIGYFGTTEGGNWTMGDFDCNGVVDGGDYDLLIGYFGTAYPGVAGANVPEPTTMGLLALGVIGLISRRRKA